MFALSRLEFSLVAVIGGALGGPEIGAEFVTDDLDVRRARYRVLQVKPDVVELTRVGWVDPPPRHGT